VQPWRLAPLKPSGTQAAKKQQTMQRASMLAPCTSIMCSCGDAAQLVLLAIPIQYQQHYGV